MQKCKLLAFAVSSAVVLTLVGIVAAKASALTGTLAITSEAPCLAAGYHTPGEHGAFEMGADAEGFSADKIKPKMQRELVALAGCPHREPWIFMAGGLFNQKSHSNQLLPYLGVEYHEGFGGWEAYIGFGVLDQNALTKRYTARAVGVHLGRFYPFGVFGMEHKF